MERDGGGSGSRGEWLRKAKVRLYIGHRLSRFRCRFECSYVRWKANRQEIILALGYTRVNRYSAVSGVPKAQTSPIRHILTIQYRVRDLLEDPKSHERWSTDRHQTIHVVSRLGA